MSVGAPYPWLEAAWRTLAGSLAAGRLGHAYLISGPAGLGKGALAERVAQSALCEAPPDAPGGACGRCRSCLLLASGHHPDRVRVGLLEDKRTIGVDQIRELTAFYALKSHYGRHKVAIIDPAETMTTNAANALLKLLEEPPPGALMMLLAHRPGRLPATILSRCQRITVTPPPWPETLAWLAAERERDSTLRDAAAHTLCGTPLVLRAQLAQPEPPLLDQVIERLGAWCTGRAGLIETARELAKHDLGEALEALELALRAAVLRRKGQDARHLRPSAAAAARLQDIANHLNSGRLFAFLDGIADARTTVARSSGVRGTDVIETLLQRAARAEQTNEHA